MKTVQQIAREIVAREGGYVNDPADPGGATKYGVTLGTMRRLGLDLTRDGVITVAVPQLEMGQGITTLIPQIVAVELGADWRQVAVMPVPPNGAQANVPLAALVTFVTNPFTLPFWMVVANRIGEFFLRFDAASASLASASADDGTWAVLMLIYEVGAATLLGCLVLAVVTPIIGYFVSGWVWRAVVSRKRARRLKVMEARLDQRLGKQ